jgi:hypothetical protein
MQVSIDLKLFPIVGMNIQEVMIGGAPDWIAPKQRLDFSFVMDLQGTERRLQTYGVVLSNDSRGLDVRYHAPTPEWRGILTKLLTAENR